MNGKNLHHKEQATNVLGDLKMGFPYGKSSSIPPWFYYRPSTEYLFFHPHAINQIVIKFLNSANSNPQWQKNIPLGYIS